MIRITDHLKDYFDKKDKSISKIYDVIYKYYGDYSGAVSWNDVGKITKHLKDNCGIKIHEYKVERYINAARFGTRWLTDVKYRTTVIERGRDTRNINAERNQFLLYMWDREIFTLEDLYAFGRGEELPSAQSNKDNAEWIKIQEMEQLRSKVLHLMNEVQVLVQQNATSNQLVVSMQNSDALVRQENAMLRQQLVEAHQMIASLKEDRADEEKELKSCEVTNLADVLHQFPSLLKVSTGE